MTKSPYMFLLVSVCLGILALRLSTVPNRFCNNRNILLSTIQGVPNHLFGSCCVEISQRRNIISTENSLFWPKRFQSNYCQPLKTQHKSVFGGRGIILGNLQNRKGIMWYVILKVFNFNGN